MNVSKIIKKATPILQINETIGKVFENIPIIPKTFQERETSSLLGEYAAVQQYHDVL